MLQKPNPRNRNLIVNINGRLVHRDKAAVSPFDSAVQGGDAVWEGLRLYEGRIFRLTEHLARLRSSAKALAFAKIPTDAEITRELRRTLAANRMRNDVHIRLTLTRGVKYTSGMDPRLNTKGPTLIILAEHKPPVYGTRGITLITSSIRRFPPDCLDPKIHHCNLIQSILAKMEANHAGADDALMLDTHGFIAETNATHIFIVTRAPAVLTGAADRGGSSKSVRRTVRPGTPPPATPMILTPHCRACPEGITRSAVLDLCRDNNIPAAEAELSLTQLYRAGEAFCTGTMGELAPVIKVDGRAIGTGKPGPITRRLSRLFQTLTADVGERVA